MNGAPQSPARGWGHAVSSQAQGLLSFHCVTFYSAQQVNANPGSLAINNEEKQLRLTQPTPP